MAHQITPDCTGCEACVAACPTGSIFLGDPEGGRLKQGQFVIDTESCTDCRVCVPICPERVIVPLTGL